MDNIIQRLLSQLTPDEVSQLMTEPTQAGKGGMTNPRLLRLMQMAKERGMSDSGVPNRFIMPNLGQNMHGGGQSPTAIANAYRGQPLSKEQALAPNAPDLYAPGSANTWLRGI